jgi:hypothetical protein
MDELEATWLKNLLCERYPDAYIGVTPEDDGARIVIRSPVPSVGATICSCATQVDISVTDGNSPVLRYLLR